MSDPPAPPAPPFHRVPNRSIRFVDRSTDEIILMVPINVRIPPYNNVSSITDKINQILGEPNNFPLLRNYKLEYPPVIQFGLDRLKFTDQNLSIIGPRNIYVYVTKKTGGTVTTPLLMGEKSRRKRKHRKRTIRKQYRK